MDIKDQLDVYKRGAPWGRIRLPTQETRVRFLIQEERRSHDAVEQLSLCATATGLVLQSPGTAAAERMGPRTCAPQQEEARRQEAHAPQLQGSPARCGQRKPEQRQRLSSAEK